MSIAELLSDISIGGYITIGLGVITATFTVIRTLRKDDMINPVFIKRSTNLIGERNLNNVDLKVEFKGQETRNLTLTNIAFWNAGKKTIRPEDVASTNKVKIRAKEGIKIFDAEILKTSIPENKFEITFNNQDNTIEINFEYLDRNQGAAIRVYHNGRNSDDIEVVGTLKSHGKIVSFESETKKTIVTNILESSAKNFMPSGDDKKIIFRILFIIALIFFAIVLFGSHTIISIIIIIHALLYLLLAFIFRFLTKTPKEFEFIEE